MLVWTGRIVTSRDIAEVKAVDVLVKHQVTAAPTQGGISSYICGWLGGNEGTHFALAIRESLCEVEIRTVLKHSTHSTTMDLRCFLLLMSH